MKNMGITKTAGHVLINTPGAVMMVLDKVTEEPGKIDPVPEERRK